MQMITQPLTELASLSDLERTPATIFKEERQRANRWVLSGVIIMFIGVAIGVIGKKLMHEEIVTVIGVLVLLAGMFFTVYPSLLPSTRPKSDSSASSQPKAPRQSRPAKYLPQGSGIEYVPSITERTTNLSARITETLFSIARAMSTILAWATAIRGTNHAQTIQLLQSAARYDRIGDYWPQHLRGQAYLAQHAGAEAAAEFQRILDRSGLATTPFLYPLAHLGLARAAGLTDDSAKARKAYQDFFALWKDADPDITIWLEAKKEYQS